MLIIGFMQNIFSFDFRVNGDRFFSVSACALKHQTTWSFSLPQGKNTQYLSNAAHFSSKSLSNLLKVLRMKWRIAGPTEGEKISYLSCASNPKLLIFAVVCVWADLKTSHTHFHSYETHTRCCKHSEIPSAFLYRAHAFIKTLLRPS